MSSSFLCRALILVGIAALAAACQPAGPSSGRSPPQSSVQLSATREGGARWHPDSVIVLPGETLYAISRRYDVPIRAIIDANRLEAPYGLRAGQTVSLPQVRTHVVRVGDTLYSISRQYGVDVATLAETNHLEPPFTIRTGTSLVLPPAVAASPTPSSAPVPATSGRPAEVAVTELPPPSPSASPPTPPPPSPPASPTSPSIQPIAPPTPLSPPSTPSAAPRPNPAPAPAPAPSPPPPEQSASLPPPGGAKGSTPFLWPVEGRLIARYGAGESGTHNDGINIAAPTGTPVLAADAGTVAYAGNELRGYGNLILIKHANGWMTAYAHNAVLLVKRGEKVRRGQMIARVGATGAVSEPQLHFEVRKGTRALDPAEYLPPTAASG